MKKIYSFIFCIFLFSCSPRIHYVGQVSAETKNIDIYISESSIKRNYELIGQGYLNTWALRLRPDRIQQIAEETARKKGADAVIISDYIIPNERHSVISTYRTDSVVKGFVTTGNSTISSLSSNGLRIFFVKYNR